MDVYCRRCQLWEQRARPPQRGETCLQCGAVLHRRRRRSPAPSTHWRALIDAIRSTKGIMFLVLYAVFVGLATMIGRPYLAALLLYAGAVRLAWRSMNMQGNSIEFPELSAQDLFNGSVMFGVAVFTVSFVVAPLVLLQLAFAGVAVSIPVAIAVAVLFFAYAPMALLLFLRSSSAAGMLALPAAIGLVSADPRGYGFLAILVLSSLGIRLALGALVGMFGLVGRLGFSVLLAPVEATFVLVAFGLCGLFVRSHARSLQVPCDEDDWEPLGPPAVETATPAPPAPPSQPVALSPVVGADGQSLLADDIPAVTGELVSGPPLTPGAVTPEPLVPVLIPPSPGAVVAAPVPRVPPPQAQRGGTADWPWDEHATAPSAAAVPPARSPATQIMGSVLSPAPSTPPSPAARSPAAEVPAPVSGILAPTPAPQAPRPGGEQELDRASISPPRRR
ncbi:MAG: hypothetical protein ABIJ09_10095 [Pseudomonadota bacterium]